MKIHELGFSTDNPVSLSSDDPEATVWEANEKSPLVVMKRVGDWCWFEVTGVASYRFPANSTDRSVRCDAFLAPATPKAVATDLYYRTVVPLALQFYGLESMHGTALSHGDGAVLLCAPTRTGKSTLAFALAARGATVLADDGVVWEAHQPPASGVDLHPIPFSLMLRQPSTEHFRAEGRETARGATKRASGPVSVEPVPIRAVMLLERSADGALVSQRLSRREAFTRLLAPSYALSLADKERKGRMMAAYLRFAAAVPVYALSYPSGLERLPQVVEHLERLLAEADGDEGSGGQAPSGR